MTQKTADNSLPLPVATYRIQLTKDFTFQDVSRIAPYLHKLGVTHLYLSPIFESTPGSTHGYDVMDFTKISDERGGAKGFAELNETIARLDPPLKIILDIVPNHMASSPLNPYWRDVLRNGRDSKYWPLFDLRVADSEKVELPVLGSPLGELMANDQIKIEKDAKEKLHLVCQGASYPLSPETIENLKDKDTSTLDAQALQKILHAQNYVFVHWTTASHKITYRRFFNITDLIGVRVEDGTMYDLAHEGLFKLLDQYPAITGVRVDHIDGLADPTGYLKRLNEKAEHVWVEKILAYDEDMPETWPIEGTTGYEFIARINQLMVDREGFEAIQKFWLQETNPQWKDFQSTVRAGKQEALEKLFSYEVERISGHSAQGGIEKDKAKIFWSGMSTELPVYRTYWAQNANEKDDRKWIEAALEKARTVYGEDFKSAETSLLPKLLSPSTRPDELAVIEWQQLSGPAMAKGLEDTAHYRFTPLAALNEVGCEAELREETPDAFFAWLQKRGRQWPSSMNATSSHDTKRAEDVRHRIYSLADQPEKWLGFYKRLQNMTQKHRTDAELSDKAAEYLLFQTILGAWPFDNKIDDVFIERIQAYMAKAIKEAKLHTTWTEPDEAYEKAIADFTRLILSDAEIQKEFSVFADYSSYAGALTSLAAQTLKILTPGIPDIYNGTESWDLSLVDPDNRRPIDFEKISAAIGNENPADRNALLDDLCKNWRSGAIKTWLTQTLLDIRKAYFPVAHDIQVEFLAVSNSYLAYRLKNAKSSLVILVPYHAGKIWRPGSEKLLLSGNDMTLHLLDEATQKTYVNLITQHEGSFDNLLQDLRKFPVAILRENY